MCQLPGVGDNAKNCVHGQADEPARGAHGARRTRPQGLNDKVPILQAVSGPHESSGVVGIRTVVPNKKRKQAST